MKEFQDWLEFLSTLLGKIVYFPTAVEDEGIPMTFQRIYWDKRAQNWMGECVANQDGLKITMACPLDQLHVA